MFPFLIQLGAQIKKIKKKLKKKINIILAHDGLL